MILLLLVGSETAINTLTDIFVEYFGKLCKLFKINVENQNGVERNNEMIYVCNLQFCMIWSMLYFIYKQVFIFFGFLD